MSSRLPIGLFDSGLGGLSVVSQVMSLMPNERIIYFADNAHVPYGERPLDEVCEFAVGITRFLIEQGAKAVVMACNMSSATALDSARKQFPDIPIIGVIEPGAEAAVKLAGDNPIGVLATSGTVKSGAYEKNILKMSGLHKVYQQACPKFVPLVESGNYESEEAETAACTYIQPLIDNGCKTIILGCTHYPFLRKVIEISAGDGVEIIDPAYLTALTLENILTQKELLSDELNGFHTFYTSGDSSDFTQLGQAFLGRCIDEVNCVKWGRDLVCEHVLI